MMTFDGVMSLQLPECFASILVLIVIEGTGFVNLKLQSNFKNFVNLNAKQLYLKAYFLACNTKYSMLYCYLWSLFLIS